MTTPNDPTIPPAKGAGEHTPAPPTFDDDPNRQARWHLQSHPKGHRPYDTDTAGGESGFDPDMTIDPSTIYGYPGPRVGTTSPPIQVDPGGAVDPQGSQQQAQHLSERAARDAYQKGFMDVWNSKLKVYRREVERQAAELGLEIEWPN